MIICFRKLQIILAFGMFSPFAMPYAIGKDLPEQVGEYVDNAISLSRQIAKNHADLSENGIVLDRVSEMQSYVAMISEDQNIFVGAANSLHAMDSLVVDVNSIEKAELEKAFKILMLLTQMNSAHEHLINKIQKYDELNSTFPDVCERLFDLYDTKTLGFSFNDHYPVDFRIYLDLSFAAMHALNQLSVYVFGEKLISTGGQIFGMSVPLVVFIITAIKSGYETIKEEIDRKKIESHVERLRRDIVKNEEYRQYARESCIKYRDQQKKTVEMYTALKERIMLTFAQYDPNKQRDRINTLIGFISSFDQGVHDTVKGRVSEWAQRAFGEPKREDSYREGFRLNLKRLQLSKLECGDGFAHVQWIREKLLQNQALDLQISNTIIQQSTRALVERFEACPIEAI